MIYTTFKQWVKGRFLETGEPRKKAYSKDELALIEMGWGYGYDAGVMVSVSNVPRLQTNGCLLILTHQKLLLKQSEQGDKND